MTETITPYLLLFAASGVGLVIGLWLVLLPAIHLIGALVLAGRQGGAAGVLGRGEGAPST